MVRSYALIALFIFALIPLRNAFAGEGGTDAREQCRTQVSGRYLSYMNDLDLLKGTLASTSEANFAMKAKRKLAAKNLEVIDAHNEALKTPAADLDEKALGLRYELDSTDEEIRDADARIAEIKNQIAKEEKDFVAFKAAIKPVFEAIVAKVINTGAYPLRIQYRHACSQYHQLCPLPSAQASSLLKISTQMEDKTACEHYANMKGD